MKPIYLLSLCLFLIQCKKRIPEKSLSFNLTYEVITSSGTWFGEYTDSTGQRAQTNAAIPGGWRYSFQINELPFEMFVGATASCLCSTSPSSPDVTINFYSNGSLFKTETNTWAKGVTSLFFKIQ
ncbi:MAG: hypothetical protein H7122_07305 [Chitinophagaceae bacterium]|nr:hypothetical protein [Chitinophagaceae bacterium]